MSTVNWQRGIEQIALTNKRHRVLGLTSVHRGAGVSLISRLVAKAIAESGSNTLLADVSETHKDHPAMEVQPVTGGSLRGCIVPSVHGFDLLPGTSADERRAFATSLSLRETLQNDLSAYQNVILDLPPVLEADAGRFSTVSAGVVCDGLLLVCAIGRDRRADISEVVLLLRRAGVTLAGVVSNEGMHTESRPQFINNLLRLGR